ncbi:MAG: prephenate dehydratase [Flavobacteriales bacterium]|nr:prephenate dehydratase [Flavobacteriales bacterium]MCB9335026.1 prephenate dehydratase [Flavobacteriales bacterium]
MKIAIQGIKGCFHQIAANKHFNKEMDVLCCSSFPELVTEVAKGSNCDMGIMAIENSIAGSILQNYKLLQQSGLKVVGEVYLPITQNLIAFPGTSIDEIEEIHSHPMAIYQCGDFLSALKNIKVIETDDTAASVKRIKKNNWKTKAAISSDLSASIYGMEILAPSIETNKENYTRFLILSKNEVDKVKNSNKASVYFSVHNRKGSLAKVLELIAKNNINLTKLQSFPIVGKSWQYYFHSDLEYDAYSNFNNLMLQLSNHTTELKILGNYKKGIK